MNSKVSYPEEIVEGRVNAESIREQGDQICTDVLNSRIAFLNARMIRARVFKSDKH